MFANPVYRAVWKAARGALGEDYRSFLDELVSQTRSGAAMYLPGVLKQYIAEERKAR
jgi:hypothetical protein